MQIDGKKIMYAVNWVTGYLFQILHKRLILQELTKNVMLLPS